MGLGIGLAINNSRAVLQGLSKRVGVFERTPKYNIENNRDSWRGKRYKVRTNLATTIEGVLAVGPGPVGLVVARFGRVEVVNQEKSTVGKRIVGAKRDR